jgi:hypothetical protein
VHVKEGLVQEAMETGREMETVNDGMADGTSVNGRDGGKLQVGVEGSSQVVDTV